MSDAETAGRAVPRGGNMTRRRVVLIFVGLLLAVLTASLNQTVVSTALPTIVGELGGVGALSWVVTAYLLASTVSTPLWGKLGDLYGRKPVFLVAIAIFMAGSVLSGLSQGMTGLIAFRAVQGLGGGGLFVGAQAILGDVVAPRERGRYQGFLGAAFGASSVAGPLLGGFFVESLSWRWAFFASVPLGIVAFVVAAFVLSIPRRDNEHGPREIDYLGVALLTAGVICLVLPTTLGGGVYPWGSWQVLGLGVLGVVLLAGFVLAERRAAEPVVPLSLFRNRVFAVSSAVSFVVGFSFFGVVTFLPLFLQVVGGSSPTVSGLELIPMTFGLLLTSIGSGQLISRWGRYKIFPILGTAIMSVGLFLLSRMDAETGALTRSAYFLLLGLGLGMVMQVLVLAAQNAVAYRNLGAATSAATFFRSIGGSFGVAIFGAVFASQLAGNLPRYLPAGGAGAPAPPAQPDPLRLQQLPEAVREGYVAAFAASLDTVFLVAVPFALLGFALAWALKEVPLRKTVETSGLGESYAMPKDHSSLNEIERALTVLVSRDSGSRIYERLARRAGVDLAPDESWALLRLGEHGPATPGDLASRLGVPEDRIREPLLRLREAGLVADGGDETDATGEPGLAVTAAGRRVADKLVAARREGLAELLEGWSPEQHEEVARLLGRLADELVREEPEPVLAGAGSSRGGGR